MNEIGDHLRSTRETTGISLEEVSNDLKIKVLILENIEAGNIGCFKDIYILKDYIHDYAKYLGLDPEEIIDEFNEHLFEYTSKIPVKEIEKAVKEQAKESTEEEKIASPYTTPVQKYSQKNYIIAYIVVGILVLLAIFWSIKQITINNEVTDEISYIR